MTDRIGSNGACRYGDPYCPCQDPPDPCHYEGVDPMTPPTLGGLVHAVGQVVRFFGRWRA